MKLVLIVAACLFSSASFAAPVSRACYRKAEQAVAKFVEPNYYDENGLEAYACSASPRGSAVICDVRASKGNGAANDTFRAVLNSSCKRTYRVELTGEE